MANPQKEKGFTPTANEIEEQLAKLEISGRCHRILRVIIRQTYGWNKKMDRLTTTQIAEKTNIYPPNNVSSLLTKLENWNIIIRSKGCIGLQKDWEEWSPEVFPNNKNLSKMILSKTIDTIKNDSPPIKNDSKILSKLIHTKEKKDTIQKKSGASPLDFVCMGVKKLAQVSDSFQMKIGDPRTFAMKLTNQYKPNYVLFRIMQIYKKIRDGPDYNDTVGYLIKVLEDLTWQAGSETFEEYRPPEDYLRMMQ